MNRGVIVLLLGVLSLGLASAYFYLRDTTPPLTRAALEEAQERWRAGGPRDYDLELEVSGDGMAVQRYRVEVRSGKVSRFEQNGRWEGVSPNPAYSIESLLEVMDRELEMAAAPPTPGAPARADLRASFDPERGFPLIFKRIAHEGMSRFIRVTRLEARLP